MDKAAYCFALIFAFGLPWSNALFRIGLWGMSICLVGSLSWVKYGQVALKHPITVTSIALFSWIAIGALYSNASSDLIFHDISHYRKLLATAPLIVICNSNKRRILIFLSLFSGVATLMTPTILDFIGIHQFFGVPLSRIANESYRAGNNETPRNLIYWKNHIVHGYFVCLLLAAAIIASLTRVKYKFFYILVVVFCLCDLLLLIQGRTALICAAIIIPFTLLSIIESKKIKIFIIFLFTLIILLTTLIPGIQQRLKSIKTEVQIYSNEKSNATSAGIRIHYWDISRKLFKKYPIIGTGPGGFRSELIANNDPLLSQNHFHAHNEFIVMSSQAGIIGLLIFMTLIYHVIKSSKSSKYKGINYFGASFLMIFIINAMTDASLFNDLEGWSFVIIAAAIASEDCFSSFSDRSKSSIHQTGDLAHI